ncbi:sperm acrosome membrane-associated protein 4 isoform X3 [Microcaecilia unicolor]|uniref:Sperm acrosome membrane-associated protein 4 isoform X3 n=1 Tax=Microcaecilia unicolor TaxID=1415580 RepID=A0A6P7XRL1_9AMPH|nr:sperm acrosome membrane-associated protein 4 isoform X3 [Microcaecilia unicolor]
MNKLILWGLVALLCIHFGEGQVKRCIKCDFTLGDIPCIQSTVTCNTGEVCATIKGKAGSAHLITKRNCVERSRCGVNDTTSWVGVTYTTSTVCCEEDFCNSGVGVIRFSLLAGLTALLCFFLTKIL